MKWTIGLARLACIMALDLSIACGANAVWYFQAAGWSWISQGYAFASLFMTWIALSVHGIEIELILTSKISTLLQERERAR